MNIKRFNRVLKRIERNPKRWYQRSWHSFFKKGEWGHYCGTAHCLAGTAELVAGFELPQWFMKYLKDEGPDYHGNFTAWDLETRTQKRAIRFLELEQWEADYLFHASRTLEDFRKVSENGGVPLRFKK